MRILAITIVSILLGVALGMGITRVTYGTSTSKDGLEVIDPADFPKKGDEPPTLAPGQLPPKVLVEKPEHNFGPLESDQNVSHNFVFKNTGLGPLTLKQGGTSCQKCTIAALANETIPPGTSGIVEVQYHPSGPSAKFRQTATILTNDPERPRVELTVFGEVTSIVEMVPNELVFSRMAVHETRSLEAKLLCQVSDKLAITGYELSNPATTKFVDVTYKPLDAEQLKTADAKSGQLITVTIKPGLPLGQFSNRVILKTDLKERATVDLRIAATIASDISIVGKDWEDGRGMLRIGAVRSAEGAKRTCLVLIRGPHRNDVELKVGEVSPDFLQVSLGKKQTINDGAVVQVPVTIEIPPGSPAVDHLGSTLGRLAEVTLDTTHPEAKQVKLRVRFAVEN